MLEFDDMLHALFLLRTGHMTINTAKTSICDLTPQKAASDCYNSVAFTSYFQIKCLVFHANRKTIHTKYQAFFRLYNRN